MVAVQASAEAVERYRQLLTAEWTKTLPGDVLSLLWATVRGHLSDDGEPLRLLLNPNDQEAFPADYFRSVVARIAAASQVFRLANLPGLSTDYTPLRKLSSVAWQGNRLATYLTLPAHTPLTGDTAFFADLQALAFQAALHFVLPTLREKKPAEHALLLHAALLFALSYSVYEPSHYAYLMSQIHGYLGDEEQRFRSLDASFRFTAPQDHSYLTRAQELWSDLLDRGRYHEAETVPAFPVREMLAIPAR